MLRKKITNKEKFQFREDEVLSPLPSKGRSSFQSRLARKADDKLTYNQSNESPGVIGIQGTFGVGTVNHGTSLNIVGKEENLHQGVRHHVQEVFPPNQAKYQTGSPDPVLDEIVAKLKSGLQLGSNTQMLGATHNMAACPKPVLHSIPPPRYPCKQEVVSTTRMLQKTCPPADSCICLRPLKLVMCEVCGETFCARVALVCSIHPRAMYLHDVKECKGCKQTNIQALKEFDLPPGMEKRIKNAVDRKTRGVGMN